MSIHHLVLELAARHNLDTDELVEVWSERAAIVQFLAGDTRRGAELEALRMIERQFQIGLHCPEYQRRATAPGDRARPAGARPCIYVTTIRKRTPKNDAMEDA